MSNSRPNTIATVPKCVAGYDVLSKLGSGSFAFVYKGMGRSDLNGLRSSVAIKCIPRKFAVTNQDRIVTEISLLKCCKHKHIVKYIDLSWNADYIFLIMEYCGGGHLGLFIHQNRSLSEETSRTIFYQLALALCYMWKRHIVHMDLKPHNILISNRQTMCIKVADFGLSQLMSDDGETSFRGSPLYMAPEIYCKSKYDGSVDLWSSGIILYECLFGRAPFASDSMEQVVQQLLSSDPVIVPQAQISYECRDLLERLLVRDPKRRINFENFFDHPFVSVDILADDLNLANARLLVNRASTEEQNGELNLSISHFQEAVELYINCMQETTNKSEKNALRQKVDEYLTKAEDIKSRLKDRPSTSRIVPVKLDSSKITKQKSDSQLPQSNAQSRSKRNTKSSDDPNTSIFLLIESKISRSKILVSDARVAWSNGDAQTALSKYTQAIDMALDAARHHSTDEKSKELIRTRVARWLSEAEDIKGRTRNQINNQTGGSQSSRR